MCYHIFAFIAGFMLDLLIGDPHFIPHPVRLIGSLISFLDKRLNCDAGYNISEKKLNLIKYKRGMLLAFTVIFATFAISVIIILAAYSINLYAGVIAEAVMTWQILATKYQTNIHFNNLQYYHLHLTCLLLSLAYKHRTKIK